jgi:hypothetical protein
LEKDPRILRSLVVGRSVGLPHRTMMDGRRRRRREKEKIRGTEEAVKILFLSYSIPPPL